VATRVFSDEELARLREFPEITAEELVRFFTLSAADAEFVDPGRGRSAKDRLGLAVQPCSLPWFGVRARRRDHGAGGGGGATGPAARGGPG